MLRQWQSYIGVEHAWVITASASHAMLCTSNGKTFRPQEHMQSSSKLRAELRCSRHMLHSCPTPKTTFHGHSLGARPKARLETKWRPLCISSVQQIMKLMKKHRSKRQLLLLKWPASMRRVFGARTSGLPLNTPLNRILLEDVTSCEDEIH